MTGPGWACFNDNEKFTIGSCCTSHLLSGAWFVQPLCTMLEQERASRNETTGSWFIRSPKVATLDFEIRVLPRQNSSLTQATAAQRRSQRTRDMDWAAPEPARLRNTEALSDGAAFAKTRKSKMTAER